MSRSPEEKWADCLSFIRNNIGESQFNIWFAPISFHSYGDGLLRLKVPSMSFIEFIEAHFVKLIRTTIAKFYGSGTQLKYLVDIDTSNHIEENLGATTRSTIPDSSSDNASASRQPFETPAHQGGQDLDPHLNPNYTFDNFIPGDSNKLTRTIALAIADKSYQNTFNPFFIYGASGVGKTHLVNAIGCRIKEKFPRKRVLYVSAHLLQIQYTDSVRNNRFNDFMNFYQSIDVLIVDDIQEIAGKTKTQEAFFNIFNHLHLNQRQLILTCDRPPVSLEGMTDRLLSRFKWGIIAELEQPNVKLRRDILNFLIKQEGLQIPQNVVNYIATNIIGNIRDLEGTINSIMAYSITYNSDIDLRLAEQVVARIAGTRKKNITIDEIIAKVGKYYSIKEREILSSSRKKEISRARHISMYLSQKYTKLSSSQIGVRIGQRDHSTVLHSCSQVEKRLNADQQFRQEFEAIEKSLFI
jgi:chromosomal replication initiator protein